MPGETIDSLTLDIGLSSEEFQSGVNRILDSMNRMQGVAEETGESMGASFAALGSSVASLAWRFAGMFLAFKSIEGLVDYFKDLSVELGNLGFAGKYLGQSGVELRRFGEVAELAGGKAQDAIAAVHGLNAAIFGLEFQGQVSQSLVMLTRMRVAYMDERGAPRDIKDIAFDAAKRLQEQFPGQANQWLRVQYAGQMFPGAPGIANAVGGPLDEFIKNYQKAVKDNSKVTDKTIDAQMHTQQALTSLRYQIANVAAGVLSDLNRSINELIRAIEVYLIPTLDELISDVMDWLHPERMLEKAAEGPMGLTHPINDLAHFGSWLGGKAADFMSSGRQERLAAIQIPSQVSARLGPNTNLDALKLLHMEAGGEAGDPTWSKAVTIYSGLKNPAGYAAHALASGELAPAAALPSAHALSTPSARRPAAGTPGAAGAKPTSSTTGPRVQIGSIGPIYTQATDANRLMSDLDRAAQRKFMVAQADPGLA